MPFLSVLVFAVLGALWPQQPDSEPDLTAARNAERAGHFADAERVYESLLARKPDAELYQRLGLVQHMQNKYSAAADSFQHALNLSQELWGSHMFLGIDLYRMNRFGDADAQLTSANRLRPNEPEVMFWLGATKLARHEQMEGFAILEKVLERQPSNAEVLRLLAESYAAFGTSLLNDVGERYPNSVPGLIVEGQALEFEGSYAQAREVYQEALAIDPTRTELHDSIARVDGRLKASGASAR